MPNTIPPEYNDPSGPGVAVKPYWPALLPVKEEKTNLKSAALEAEYDLILKVLKEVNFNKSKAAKILNIDRKTLYNKMRAFKLDA